MTSLPAGRACTVPGWSEPSTFLLSCASTDGQSYDLLAVDAERPARTPTTVGTSDQPVSVVALLDDGRVGVASGTPGGCLGGGDPAILEDGRLVPLTDQWGPNEHGYFAQFSGTGVMTQLTSCDDGTPEPGRERNVRTNLVTGAVTELGGPGPMQTPLPDGWIRSPSSFLAAS